MRKKINYNTLIDLIHYNKKLLWSNKLDTLIVIQNFNYITIKSKYYITNINILAWNVKTNRWTILNKRGIKSFFKNMKKEPVNVLRDNYILKIKNPLGKIENIIKIYE